MNILGKEIKPEVITMWVNIMGFVAGIIFYLNVESNISKPVSERNPLQDTLVKIDFKLSKQIESLKTQQDSLVSLIRSHEEKLEQRQIQVQKQKVKIETTLHTEWDTLSSQQREDYTSKLINNLKNKKP